MFRGSIILLSCILVMALAIIGCGGGGGGSNPVGPAISTSETASLSGTVIFDDAPLANAAVFLYKSDKAHTIGMAQLPTLRRSLLAQQLISDGAYSTTTNASGAYSFVDVPVGQYTLIAVKNENNQFAQTGVLLGAVTTLDAQLTPTGKISGKVQIIVGGVAQNVSGALVYVAGTSYVALTDTLGNFVINNVPSNVLTTSAAYEVRVMPGHGDASPVTGVRVNPGETTTIPAFALTAPTTNYAILSGQLVPGTGLASADMANHFIIITSQTDGTVMGTRSDAGGNYQFSVTKTGTYLVMCAEEDYDYNPDPLSISVTALSNTTLTLSNITVFPATIQNVGSIIGLVTDAGLPVTGAIVHVTDTSLLGVSDTSGRFVIERVPVITAPSSYSVEVSASNGTAPAKTGIVVNIGQATDIGVFAITRPAAGYKNIVGTLTPVLPVTQAMLTNRLVQLTSPDGKTSSAYSNAAGGFSFMTAQTGNHNITVIDSELAYAPRTQIVTVATLDNATLPLASLISATDPNFDNRVSVDGTIFKDIKIRPETDESGVSVKFAPLSATEEPLFTFTQADGSFRFMVAPGTYTLSVEGLYQLNPLAPITVNITGPYSFPATINVRPSQTVTSVVEGSVSWPAIAGWIFTEGEVILEGATFVDHRIVSSTSPAPFRFENVPPGAYTLRTNPFRNGYDGSIALSVTEGTDLTGQSLTTTFIAPFITTSAAAGYTLSLLGQNFGTTASMQGYVADKPLPQTGIWNATNCSFDITSLTPGEHAIKLISDISGGKLEGNKVVFSRPILSPLPASFVASSTDTTISFTWQNEPFINEVEIRLLQGATVVKPLQRYFGNSVTFNGLQNGVSYTIEVSSTYPGVITSSPTSFTFSTKAESVNSIPSFAFTGAGIATGTVFGFEVVDGVAYVGFQDGAVITIQSFDLTTNALLNSSAPIVTSNNVAMRSMAANANGVWLTYSVSAGNNAVSYFDSSLGLVNSIDLIIDLGFSTWVEMETVHSFADRIFLVVREGGVSPAPTYLRELEPTLLTVLQTAPTIMGSSNATGKTADLAYDRNTGLIYMVYPNTSFNNEVVTFSNMDITTPSIPIGEINSANRVILGLYTNNDKIYLSEQAVSYSTGTMMDTKSGYVQTIISTYSGCFGFDRQNRLWTGSHGLNLDYLFELNDSLNVVQSLKISNIDYLYFGLPMVRLDISTGIMYMLHFDSSNTLAVYRYDSNF